MRPLNLPETLDASVKIVSSRFVELAKVVLVVALPIAVLEVLVIRGTTDVYSVSSGFGSDDSATVFRDRGTFVVGQIVLGALQYVLMTAACYRLVSATYLGEHVSAAESLRFAANRAAATLWLLFLIIGVVMVVTTAVVLPFAALGAPALALLGLPALIWISVAWSAALPAMYVEGPSGPEALRRSFALVKDRWWATLGRLFVGYILVGVTAGIATAAFNALIAAAVSDTSLAALALSHACGVLVNAVTLPFLVAVITVMYFDLRARKEGHGGDALPEADSPLHPTPASPEPWSFSPGTTSDPARWVPPQAPTSPD